MPSASYSDYARIMLALPGTAKQVAERVEMKPRAMLRILRRLWALRMVRPDGRCPDAPANHPELRWAAGDGPAVLGARAIKPDRPCAQLIAFSYIWRALKDGDTVPSIVEQSGASRISVYRLLKTLGKNAHVMGWEPHGTRTAVAVWVLGPGVDAKKPPRKPCAQICREWRQRQVVKALQFLPAKGRLASAGAAV
jgi:hypothetical protein